MNKRNTEGYVLAYLLIVIAVMGAIAATLMTSTVQVMAAQQNSIRYMQDKYEAMGEVERLTADVMDLKINETWSDSTTGISSKVDAENAVKSAALAKFLISVELATSTELIPDDNDPNLYQLPVSYDSVRTHVDSLFEIRINTSIQSQKIEPDVPDLNDPDGEELEDTSPTYNAQCTIKIDSILIKNYNVTPIGGVS